MKKNQKIKKTQQKKQTKNKNTNKNVNTNIININTSKTSKRTTTRKSQPKQQYQTPSIIFNPTITPAPIYNQFQIPNIPTSFITPKTEVSKPISSSESSPATTTTSTTPTISRISESSVLLKPAEPTPIISRIPETVLLKPASTPIISRISEPVLSGGAKEEKVLRSVSTSPAFLTPEKSPAYKWLSEAIQYSDEKGDKALKDYYDIMSRISTPIHYDVLYPAEPVQNNDYDLSRNGLLPEPPSSTLQVLTDPENQKTFIKAEKIIKDKNLEKMKKGFEKLKDKTGMRASISSSSEQLIRPKDEFSNLPRNVYLPPENNPQQLVVLPKEARGGRGRPKKDVIRIMPEAVEAVEPVEPKQKLTRKEVLEIARNALKKVREEKKAIAGGAQSSEKMTLSEKEAVIKATKAGKEKFKSLEKQKGGKSKK